MKKLLKKVLPAPLVRGLGKIVQQRALKQWENKGRPAPPPHIVKSRAITAYSQLYHTSILIETGTYLGDMIYAQKDHFKQIISIELAQILFENAVKRFRKYPHIRIIQGDSGTVLPAVVSSLKEKAIFWLDGHYSGGPTAKGNKECPIYEELDAIFQNDLGHVLLIDDARCFNGTNDYPSLSELESYIKSKNSRYQVEVKDDIIRATLK